VKDKHDKETLDWLDDSEERRLREEQEHARRKARREKHERLGRETTPEDRQRSRS
jgi:hypothetical protein